MSHHTELTLAFGSSPLARGLRVHRRAPGGCTGIIPARAGFTSGRSTAYRRPTDHPRSRGVYSGLRSVQHGIPGSSPLARGLPATPAARRAVRRIIPARAGFTAGGDVPTWKWGDHPRSRGVYGPRPGGHPQPHGSSPLARGLHLVASRMSRLLRIIPARAGFTAPSGRGGRSRPDHPRSRGVYGRRSAASGRGSGSSPLARGLLEGGGREVEGPGIIPARAGFTMRS